MITLTALALFMLESHAIYSLDRKYMREGETRLTVDEFIVRATLQDILLMRHHVISSWLLLGIATMGTLFRH